MIDVSGHLRDFRRECGFAEEEKPLVINCCGYQKFVTKDYVKERPKGRLDYQLIYIAEGMGEYLLDGEKRRVTAGNVLLYAPGEPQIYRYYSQDSPSIYWIHFTGYAVEKILEKYQISSGYVGVDIQLQEIFREIIRELQLKKKCYEDVTELMFYKLLALLCRAKMMRETPSKYHNQFDSLIVMLNQNYQKQWTIQQMAEYCSLSQSYFWHSFKNVMKVTPMQYLSDLRMTKAKELLSGSDISISSVAAILGYEDPMYFSRAFKKYTGVPPKAYRKDCFSDDMGSPVKKLPDDRPEDRDGLE